MTEVPDNHGVANVTITVTMDDGRKVTMSKDDPYKFAWGLDTEPNEADLRPLGWPLIQSRPEKVTGFYLSFQALPDDDPFVTFDLSDPRVTMGSRESDTEETT